MGRLNDEEVKLWEAVGGRVERRAYRSGVSKFYFTPEGAGPTQKLDSWVKAKNWLMERHPEVFHVSFDPKTGPSLFSSAKKASGVDAAAAGEPNISEPPAKPKKSGGVLRPNGTANGAGGGEAPDTNHQNHDGEEFEDEDVLPPRPRRRVLRHKWTVMDDDSSASPSVEIVEDKAAQKKKRKKREREEREQEEVKSKEEVADEEEEEEDDGSEEEEEEDEAFDPSESEVESSDSDPDYIPEKKHKLKKRGRGTSPPPSASRHKRRPPPEEPPPKRGFHPSQPEQQPAKRHQQQPPQPAPAAARHASYADYIAATRVPQQAYSQPQHNYYTNPSVPSSGASRPVPGQPSYQSTQPTSVSNTWQQALAAAAAFVSGAPPQAAPKQTSHEAATAFYKAGQFQLAEENYTNAIKEMESKPEAAQTLPVMFGNRAAARLKQGKVAEAIEDNLHSLKLDPKYAKAYTRIADCHLRSGDFAKAREAVQQGLDNLKDLIDKQAELEQKMAQIKDLERGVPKLLHDVRKDMSNEQLTRLMTDAKTTLDLLADVEAIKVVQATAYLRQMEFDKCLQYCQHQATVPWQWWLALQVKYHQGDLPDAVAMAKSRPQSSPDTPDTSAALGVTLPSEEEISSLVQHMEQLVKLKEEGNAAIGQKNYQLTVDKYNAALALQPPAGFAAVLYSNRSWAQENLENSLEALADSGRAKALKPSYAKPYLRLANQLSEFRRANEAMSVLQDLLEKVPEGTKEHREASSLLQDMRIKAGYFKTPDHYKFLAVPRNCSEDDVRRAYKRRALVYHPDKAIGSCKCTLQMGDSGIHLVSTELHARLKKEAHTLFTYIAEAYEQLSDAAKRKMIDVKLQAEWTASQSAMTKARAKNQYAAQQPANSHARSAAWNGYNAAASSARSHGQNYYAAAQSTSQTQPSRPQTTQHGFGAPHPATVPGSVPGHNYFSTTQPNGAAGQQPPAAFFGFNAAPFGAGGPARPTFFSTFHNTQWH